MSKLTDEDFIRVNAFHDNEMAEDHKAFSRRLEAEPALKAALAEIREVSTSLKALKPQPARHPSLSNDNRPAWHGWIGSTLVGSLAGAVAIALLVGIPANRQNILASESAVAIHESFSSQTFVSHDEVFNTVAWEQIEQFPDLSAANLTLVALRELPHGVAAHFAGREGCRLTVFSSKRRVANDYFAPALQSAEWEVPGRFYRTFATDMDEGKFAAITAYLEQATRKTAQPTTVIALKNATARATSCG
ncbi:hypothetical protein NA8A_16486 [Nitratireductor indicus C115]|uniref:Transmembrane anti-sigma factor n=1 Tax=Nitratireductor indicus C115 TaxID=1231190 RepID=K2PJY7_9HYPH|nr:hypothetical protein [Nitratireductor indicus]EKF41467.1 hypothetical protein NA8A_16486 [Nitratireductor indicus C115]SFQ71596.1 hypothetical protein SAMN05216176_1119 [Nitratireductor indicus]